MSSSVQVNLWGLDAIKTKGESVAIVLYLLGARPLHEATGRVARYELIPLQASPLCLQDLCCIQARVWCPLLTILSAPWHLLMCMWIAIVSF